MGTRARAQLNRLLRRFNLRVDTLTAETREMARLRALEGSGHFGRPVFPLPASFRSMAAGWVLEAVSRYRSRFDDFEDPSRNHAAYSFANAYFTSPDVEVLYSVVRESKPARVVEVGSGHSSRVIRQAIRDGQLSTRLISIDPEPREEVCGVADQVYRTAVEGLEGSDLFRSFQAGDILFIDSSHVVKTGNDVVVLYLILLPSLPPGVLIHIHDVFLPYDYPSDWVLKERFGWNEQYLVQALLMAGDGFEALWAGHFFQRTRPDFAEHFPHLKGRVARSLWLRRTG
jgi:predicted O-methyltransferase YrrM